MSTSSAWVISIKKSKKKIEIEFPIPNNPKISLYGIPISHLGFIKIDGAKIK